MESSEVRLRSVVTSVALLGVGALLGASATWLIMSALGSADHRDGSRFPRSTGSSVAEDGRQTTTSRQRCTDQLRSILAELEVRLMDTVDELLAHFSMSVRQQADKSSARKLSPTTVKSSKSQYAIRFL